jgi:hypothetical protein
MRHGREICVHEMHELGRCREVLDLSPGSPILAVPWHRSPLYRVRLGRLLLPPRSTQRRTGNVCATAGRLRWPQSEQCPTRLDPTSIHTVVLTVCSPRPALRSHLRRQYEVATVTSIKCLTFLDRLLPVGLIGHRPISTSFLTPSRSN